ncbi:hypothetical protein H4582DRAFT_1950166 [Lactarius indigo]|nr:hypothetical protein H4582DRAFT_1950166 [Lactarius indigo]
MASQRSDTHDLRGLTEAESMLILPAARLCAALNYLAYNPGGDSLYYAEKTSGELQLVTDISREYPSTQEAPHRIHPVLRIVGKRWRRTACGGRSPKLEDISLESIKKSCANLAKRDPNQPPVFYSTDLSTLVDRIPRVQHWWKTDAKQREGRSNKGKTKDKAPVPLDPNTDRSAAAVSDEEDDGERPSPYRVRFQSPDAPPKQRRRLGDDRCDACKQRNVPVCEPQWDARRSFACKTCARRKTACRTTRVWQTEITNWFQCMPQGPRHVQADVTNVPARPASGAPAVQADDVPVLLEGTVAMGAGAGHGRAIGPNAAPPAVDTNSRLSAIEASLIALNVRLDRTDTDISAIKGHQTKQVEILAALERTQDDLKKMVLMLCGYHAVSAAPGRAVQHSPPASRKSETKPASRFGLRSSPRLNRRA